jgi:hypothetical protein
VCAAVASKRKLWNRFGRLFSGVVIACFFLPFFGISCDHLDVVQISGADMVAGCKPGGLLTSQKEHESAKEGDIKVENVPREPLAIAAFGCALVAFALAWKRSRNALLGACGISIVGIGLLIALFFKFGADLEAQLDEDMKHQSDVKIMKKEEVSSGGRYGLWLTAFGLLSIATITGLALREPEEPPPAA